MLYSIWIVKPTTNRNGDVLWALHSPFSLTHTQNLLFILSHYLLTLPDGTRRPTNLYEFSFTHWCTQTHTLTLTHTNISSHFQFTTLFGCQDVKISCAFSGFSNSNRWRSLFFSYQHSDGVRERERERLSLSLNPIALLIWDDRIGCGQKV